MTKFHYMDQLKAQRLLIKIQTLIDQGSPLSKLEADLVKSYILQLYEAVAEVPVSDTQIPAPEPSSPPKVSAPPVFVPPVTPPPPPPAPKPEVEARWEPVVEHHRVTEVEERPDTPEPVPHVPAFTPPPIPEPVTPVFEETRPGETSEALLKLFDPPAHSEPTAANVVIPSIEEAIGINDRIFILNDLFGGNSALMQETFTRLNGLHSFREARQLLATGVAARFDWANAEHQKKAVEFIRIVRRRYPSES